jgi:hypothetical protein
MKLQLFLFSVTAILAHCQLTSAFAFAPTITKRQKSSLLSASSDEVARLKQSASKLREEANALRQSLNDSSFRRKNIAPNASSQPPPPVAYTSLEDSCWTLTYRFSNQPNDDDDDTNGKDNPRINYSGTLTIKFRSDGYTDLISHEPAGASPRLDIEKVWGWDEEFSNEDDETYVLFSVNAKSGDRYCWQARIDVNDRNEISLADGTVTVKRNVKPPGGFWGVFNGAGILAQFQSVGNFGGKPTRV